MAIGEPPCKGIGRKSAVLNAWRMYENKIPDTYPNASSIVTHAKTSSVMVLALGQGASSARSLCPSGHSVSVALSLCSDMV